MTWTVFAQAIGPCACNEHAWSSKVGLLNDGWQTSGRREEWLLVSVCAGFIPAPELSPRADCSVLSAVSWLSGSFMHSFCFMIPVMTFSVSAVILVASAVWFASPGNLHMSLSIRVVVVPVLMFLRTYDGVSKPWCFLWLLTTAGIFQCPSWSLRYTVSPGLNTSGFRRPLFILCVCFILLPSLSFFVSELSIILWALRQILETPIDEYKSSDAYLPTYNISEFFW